MSKHLHLHLIGWIAFYNLSIRERETEGDRKRTKMEAVAVLGGSLCVSSPSSSSSSSSGQRTRSSLSYTPSHNLNLRTAHQLAAFPPQSHIFSHSLSYSHAPNNKHSKPHLVVAASLVFFFNTLSRFLLQNYYLNWIAVQPSLIFSSGSGTSGWDLHYDQARWGSTRSRKFHFNLFLSSDLFGLDFNLFGWVVLGWRDNFKIWKQGF